MPIHSQNLQQLPIHHPGFIRNIKISVASLIYSIPIRAFYLRSEGIK